MHAYFTVIRALPRSFHLSLKKCTQTEFCSAATCNPSSSFFHLSRTWSIGRESNRASHSGTAVTPDASSRNPSKCPPLSVRQGSQFENADLGVSFSVHRRFVLLAPTPGRPQLATQTRNVHSPVPRPTRRSAPVQIISSLFFLCFSLASFLVRFRPVPLSASFQKKCHTTRLPPSPPRPSLQVKKTQQPSR